MVCTASIVMKKMIFEIRMPFSAEATPSISLEGRSGDCEIQAMMACPASIFTKTTIFNRKNNTTMEKNVLSLVMDTIGIVGMFFVAAALLCV